MDVDESFVRLTRYDEGLAAPATPALLPVLASSDDMLQLQSSQVGPVLQSYHRMLSAVRLVDPGLCLQVSDDTHGHRMEAGCYAIWGKECRCNNCIAQEAIRSRRTQNKIESTGSDIFYVLALCVEIDSVPYAPECANPLQASGREENLRNQLLVRNRQVYLDSATNQIHSGKQMI